MSGLKFVFEPVYDKDSLVLILGSFPSVKSRQTEFYYGNPQNRFWKVLSSYLNVPLPVTADGKREMLLKHRIAVWDIVTECEIIGSSDASIKNFKVADIKSVLQNSCIRYIILNGAKAFSVFEANYGGIGIPYVKLSSTSPANTRFDIKEWFDALSIAFGKT